MKIEKRLKKRFPSIEYSIQPLFLVSNIPRRGRNESFADGRKKQEFNEIPLRTSHPSWRD